MFSATSLRQQVAMVIAVLSVLPNVVMAATVLLPLYRRSGELGLQIWLTVAAWMVGVVLVAVVIGYLLSRQLLAPLHGVTRDIAALHVTARGLAGARLPLMGSEPTEVMQLKRSFNDLLEQVRVEQSRRDSFMATVMHDLKTPLVASSHLLRVVRDTEDLGRSERIAVVDHLLHENDALIALVQKLVDAHRFERASVELALEETDIGALVRNTVARVAPLARERGIHIAVSGEGRARVDPREFERAVYNLVSNAVRYAASRIDVRLYAGLIRLSDDGPGLPAPLEELAQPFKGRPIDIAGKRYTAGTSGLGLFIARRVVEAHGGRLVTENSGGGTTLLIYYGKGVSR